MDKRKIVQIGIIVADIEAATEQWSRFTGQSSEITQTEPYAVTGAMYLGKPCHGLIRQSFFEFENIQIELISPCGEEASIWKDCLAKSGWHIHHIAFATDAINADIQALASENMPLLQIGQWPAEPKDGTYAYIDSCASLGGMIELLCTE